MTNKYDSLIRQIVLIVILVGTFSSCQEDLPSGAPGSVARFVGYETCDIIAPPSAVQLNSYYTKYTNCSGIPVIGNDEVPDEAFHVANETIDFMLQGMNNVKEKLIERGEYYILAPPGANARDVPEFTNQNWATSTGAYGSELRAAVSSSAGLLCMSYADGNTDGHSNVFVHELSHMIDISGLRLVESGFESALTSAYNNAISQGLWTNTYAASNRQEYFSQCIQMYFEVGFPFVEDPSGDGNWNHIHTRAELQQYDPTIYNLIASRFNSSLNVPGCIQGENYEPWQDPSVNCGTSVTDIDGNTYGIVRAGNMCWMDENLKTTRYRDGTSIPNVSGDTQWEIQNNGAWAAYGNSASNISTYGRLYNWYAVDNSSGLCPEGWHLATQEEWQSLMSIANSYGSGTGGALKALNLWNQPNEGATNETGFSALPSGIRTETGVFTDMGHHTSFWSATESDASTAFSYGMWSNGNFTIEATQDKSRGQACRCVKD